MACWGAAAGNFLISARRSVVHRRWNPRSSGFLRPFHAARSRYACADLSNTPFGRQRFFRYVRNPMYVAVVSLILGQGRFLAASAFLNTVLQFAWILSLRSHLRRACLAEELRT